MSTVKAVPEGHHTVTPVLVVRGAAEAISFYQKAFGAEEIMRAPGPNGTIMHAMIRIGNSVVYLSDEFPQMGSKATSSRLWLYVDNVDAAWQRAVAAGAPVTMPLTDMFWGDRFGQVADAWGNVWGLAQHVRDVSPAEMEKAQKEMLTHWGKQK